MFFYTYVLLYLCSSAKFLKIFAKSLEKKFNSVGVKISARVTKSDPKFKSFFFPKDFKKGGFKIEAKYPNVKKNAKKYPYMPF